MTPRIRRSDGDQISCTCPITVGTPVVLVTGAARKAALDVQ
ncbi:MAG: hypothetical protein WKF64_06360 [Ilumatobacteraceae bacterium]|jgi:hypothetical protein